MVNRRSLVLAAFAGPACAGTAWAQQRQSLVDPLRLGVDLALVESGLARSLQRAFGRDTGIAVQLVPGAALPLLESLERGELDAGLTNAPDAELKLERQGLLHDRRAVAVGGMVLVGPAPKAMGKGKVQDPEAVASSTGIVQALQRIVSAAPTPEAPDPPLFLSAGDGSGAHLAEQALWRAARLAPAAPWYAVADKGTPLAAQARARGAYALVERGSWAAQGGAPLAVLVEGDALLGLPVHVMRSFRVNHPAGKIFVSWISGPRGARVVAAQRGYRPPTR